MTHKPLLLLKYHLYYSKNKGFILPIATGIGLVMILLVVTMGVRTQEARTGATRQVQTNESLGVAETGITRTISLLKKYPVNVEKDINDWTAEEDIANNNIFSETCSDNGGSSTDGSSEVSEEDMEKLQEGQWIPIDLDNPSKGQYKLLEYSYNQAEQVSTIKVQGQAVTSDTATANTVIEVQLSTQTVNPSDNNPSNIPGIWVDDKLSTPIDVSTDGSLNANILVKNTNCTLPEPSKISEDKLEKENGAIKPIYNGSLPTVLANPSSLPSLPSPPNHAYTIEPIDASNCYIVLPRISSSDRSTGVPTDGTNCDKSEIKSDFEHITSDTPTNGIYSYLIESTGSTGDSIKLSNSQLIIDPPPNTKVVLYVRGNILISGTGGDQSRATTCIGTSTKVSSYLNKDEANKLEIYGADASGGTWGSGYKMEKINVSDTTMISAFIYAPTATVDISQGQIKGSVWAKEFKASNSSGCKIAVRQDDVGLPLAVKSIINTSIITTLDKINSWQRREITSTD